MPLERIEIEIISGLLGTGVLTGLLVAVRASNTPIAFILTVATIVVCAVGPPIRRMNFVW